MRLLNAAAYTLATGALETKAKKGTKDQAQIKELRPFNRVQEKLLVESTSLDERSETPVKQLQYGARLGESNLLTHRLWNGVTCQVTWGIGEPVEYKYRSCLE